MVQSLLKSMQRIREATPVLNKATDEAQAIVARVEKFLDECSVGVHAHVQFSDEDVNEELSRQRSLSYERVDGKFRIAVTTTACLEIETDGDPYTKCMPDEDNPPVAWGSCPRHIKLASFGSLPGLLSRIAEEASGLSRKAGETTEAVKQILDELNTK